ncbi:MAG: SDR family oxidoreductase [Anaerolineae bacterium]|nr:SDR family oxidoreductase [Anaerolineae bacterium]
MQLQDKVALITGGGSGIGAATAHLFATEGAKVAVLGRTENELNAVVSDIKANNGEAIPVLADISKPEQVEKGVQTVIDHFGRLDIVFANAGINGVWAPVDDLTIEEWQQTININLNGTFYTIKYAVPYLKKQGGAIIINSSVNGTRIFSNTGATAYSATKAGQDAMAKMLAVELGKFKVRVNVICPGAITTQIRDNTTIRNLDKVRPRVDFIDGRIPLTGGKPGKAEEVAQVVLFLASDASSHVTGTEIWIDGAESLLQG